MRAFRLALVALLWSLVVVIVMLAVAPTKPAASVALNTPLPVSISASTTLSITQYPLNPGTSGAGSIIRGPDGNVWFAESLGSSGYAIAKITPAGIITDYPIPGKITMIGSIASIAAGPDGNIWYTDDNTLLGKMTLTGIVTTYTLSMNVNATNITFGSDGNIWMVSPNDNRVLRINTSGVVTGIFDIPTANSVPYKIIAGPDGNLWFVEWNGGNLGRITPSGVITEFPVGIQDPTKASLRDIIVGPDNKIWFTEVVCDVCLGVYGNIATDVGGGQVTVFQSSVGRFLSLVNGSDGNLWSINDGIAGVFIYRLTLNGLVTLAYRRWGYHAGGGALGGDGQIWFPMSPPDTIATFDPRSFRFYYFFPFVPR